MSRWELSLSTWLSWSAPPPPRRSHGQTPTLSPGTASCCLETISGSAVPGSQCLRLVAGLPGCGRLLGRSCSGELGGVPALLGDQNRDNICQGPEAWQVNREERSLVPQDSWKPPRGPRYGSMGLRTWKFGAGDTVVWRRATLKFPFLISAV